MAGKLAGRFKKRTPLPTKKSKTAGSPVTVMPSGKIVNVPSTSKMAISSYHIVAPQDGVLYPKPESISYEMPFQMDGRAYTLYATSTDLGVSVLGGNPLIVYIMEAYEGTALIGSDIASEDLVAKIELNQEFNADGTFREQMYVNETMYFRKDTPVKILHALLQFAEKVFDQGVDPASFHEESLGGRSYFRQIYDTPWQEVPGSSFPAIYKEALGEEYDAMIAAEEEEEGEGWSEEDWVQYNAEFLLSRGYGDIEDPEQAEQLVEEILEEEKLEYIQRQVEKAYRNFQEISRLVKESEDDEKWPKWVAIGLLGSTVVLSLVAPELMLAARAWRAAGVATSAATMGQLAAQEVAALAGSLGVREVAVDLASLEAKMKAAEAKAFYEAFKKWAEKEGVEVVKQAATAVVKR